MAKPRIVLFDLETLPNLPEALKVWTQLGNYPGLTLKASISSIICFGWKVYGQKKTNIINAWDFPSWKKDVNDDRALVKAAYEVLRGADAIVTHNGKRFDEKHFRTRCLIHGINPLPRIPHVDTCQEAKKHGYFFNNRLNTLGEHLAGEKKMEHEGWDLWVKVHRRDPKAMAKMAAYCKQDVKLLEKVYERVRAMSSSVPNHNLFTLREEAVCPNCGGDRLRSMGNRVTKTKAYRRFVCRDCGTYSHVTAPDTLPRTSAT